MNLVFQRENVALSRRTNLGAQVSSADLMEALQSQTPLRKRRDASASENVYSFLEPSIYDYLRFSNDALFVYTSVPVLTSSLSVLHSEISKYLQSQSTDCSDVDVTIPRQDAVFEQDGPACGALSASDFPAQSVTAAALASALQDSVVDIQGAPYTFVAPQTQREAGHMFYLTLQQPLPLVWDDFAEALKSALVELSPDVSNSDIIEVDLASQMEFIAPNGDLYYRVYYTWSLNGSEITSLTHEPLRNSDLARYLGAVTRPSGLPYMLSSLDSEAQDSLLPVDARLRVFANRLLADFDIPIVESALVSSIGPLFEGHIVTARLLRQQILLTSDNRKVNALSFLVSVDRELIYPSSLPSPLTLSLSTPEGRDDLEILSADGLVNLVDPELYVVLTEGEIKRNDLLSLEGAIVIAVRNMPDFMDIVATASSISAKIYYAENMIHRQTGLPATGLNVHLFAEGLGPLNPVLEAPLPSEDVT